MLFVVSLLIAGGAAARPDREEGGGWALGRGRSRVAPPVLTSHADFLRAVGRRNGRRAEDVRIGAGAISYTVDGERRQCAPLPAGTPWGLIELLQKGDVEFDAARPAGADAAASGASDVGAALTAALLSLAPAILLGALVGIEWLRTRGRGKYLGGTGTPSRSAPGAGLGFAAVGGLESACAELREVIDMLTHPERFERLGIRPVRGVLLVGPPGTGKTLLARAVAAEAGVRFYAAAASEFHAPYVGEGARHVRDLFGKARDARAARPAVVFIDELDALGAERGGSALSGASHREYDATLTQLLACMDGALAGSGAAAAGSGGDRAGERVLVIAATNRYEVLDRALTRPGRFDRVIHVRLPGARAREKILKLHTARIAAPIDADVAAVAQRARGMSGAQLAALANEAAVRALRRGGETARVSEDDFVGALAAVRRSGIGER